MVFRACSGRVPTVLRNRGIPVGNKPKKNQGKVPAPKHNDVILREFDIRQMKWLAVIIVIVGTIVLPLAFIVYLMVKVLAGETTTVDVQIVGSLTGSLVLSTGTAFVWGNRHRRRANRAEAKTRALGRDVKELQSRLRGAGMDTKVSR